MSNLTSARVIKSTGSWYHVIDENNKVTECRLRGKFRVKGIKTTNPIAVGDIVDFDKETGIISNIHPRKNHIIRKATKLSKQSHIIAANLDQAIVIASLVKPRTSTGFIDRFLATAEAYHIPAVIVFNKIDLLDKDLEDHLDELISIYEKAGYKCLTTSVTETINLELFSELLHNKISLLSGHSGVGKSALINTIDSDLQLRTGDISDYHAKGTHTTTFAEMFKLKTGGFIIDSPGIKEFGLIEFEKTELAYCFPDFREFISECKYNNCLHINEPGCSVIEAVKNDNLSLLRYENYLNILDSI
jgi:ribosome biogenesis GTPase